METPRRRVGRKGLDLDTSINLSQQKPERQERRQRQNQQQHQQQQQQAVVANAPLAVVEKASPPEETRTVLSGKLAQCTPLFSPS